MLDTIHGKGAQLVEVDRMKKVGCYRIVLELTVEDSKRLAGSLGIAEINELLFDYILTPTEIQNEHQTLTENDEGH